MEAHEVLGVPPDASEDRIRVAFKSLALKWHPDRRPACSRDEATAKFVEINRANKTMLRNIRRARQSVHSSQATTPSTSSPSSPETTSSSLPEEYSDTSSSSASDFSHSSPSSFSSRSSSPSFDSTNDKPQTRSSSPEHDESTHLDRDLNVPGTQRPSGRGQSPSLKQDSVSGNDTPKSQDGQGSARANLGPEREEVTLRPVRSTFRTGNDAPKRWIHVLNMSLEDLFDGKTLYFRVVRYRRSGKRTILPLEVYVPAGSSSGMEIVVEDAGNERRNGTMQAIVFVVKEIEHQRFRRIQEDLLMEVQLPWVDALNQESGLVYFRGIDGREYKFDVDYHTHGLLSGTTVIPDAGMPIESDHSVGGPGRGRVVIRWEISSPKSSWGTLKQILRFKG